MRVWLHNEEPVIIKTHRHHEGVKLYLEKIEGHKVELKGKRPDVLYHDDITRCGIVTPKDFIGPLPSILNADVIINMTKELK